jgi:hypothetical protein
VPVLVPLLIPFFAFAAAIVLIGLSQSHTAAHGSASVSGFWQFLSSGLLKTLLGQIAQAGRWVVAHFAAAQLNLLSRWLMGMGTLTLGWFGVNAAFAEAMVAALERVEHRGDPKARAKAAGAATAATAAAKVAHKGVRLGHSNAADLHHFQTKTDARIRPLHHATTVVLPRDIGRIKANEKDLEQAINDLKGRARVIERGAIKTFEWLRAHPYSAAMGVFSGVVAVALGRLGYGFLRCNNWRNLGKRMTCGMGAWILKSLELLAGFALTYLAVLKPQVLAEEAVAAVDTIESVLTQILDS